MGEPFKEGEFVILIDPKGRIYMRTLQRGKRTQLGGYLIEHDSIIGMSEGVAVAHSGRGDILAFRPTLSEYILKMRRGAQVIYPKDAGVILMWADIYPGATVVEAGLGSGALTMALLRAVGEKGKVISYEVRREFIKVAMENIERFLGPCPNLIVKEKDVYEGIDEREVDRVVLDLSQPWLAVPHAGSALKGGGVLLSFSPNVNQVHQTVMALKEQGQFHIMDTIEVLIRPWVIQERIARPELRMVAHTGFITVARKR